MLYCIVLYVAYYVQLSDRESSNAIRKLKTVPVARQSGYRTLDLRLLVASSIPRLAAKYWDG